MAIATQAMTNPEQIIESRQGTHGSFKENSRLTRAFLRVAETGLNYKQLNDMQLEALHMNFHKISRLLSGDCNEPDHWLDSGNYMHLPEKFKADDIFTDVSSMLSLDKRTVERENTD